MLMMFKDIRSEYEADKKAGKPWWLSKRFIGLCVTLIGAVLQSVWGVSLNADTLGHLTDDAATLGAAIPSLIPACIGIYGVVLHVVGQIHAVNK